MLLQMGPADEYPDPDEFGRWQVRIEYVAWSLLHSGGNPNAAEVFLGQDYIGPLEQKLDDLFTQVGLTAHRPPTGNEEEECLDHIRFTLFLDSLYVRGEGHPEQIEALARALYGPHDEWMRRNLGFTIGEAYTIVSLINDLMWRKLDARRALAKSETNTARAHLNGLLLKEINDLTAEERRMRELAGKFGVEQVANNAGMGMMFERFRDCVSFAQQELIDECAGQVPPGTVDAFLNRMSAELGKESRAPDLVGFNPLVQTPLIAFDGRYLMPSLATCYDALLSTFHYDLIRDSAYRNIYDNARANWLEERAASAIGNLFKDAQVGWRLSYGPKKARSEVDGLVHYDNKLILIQCKWKDLTLDARTGNVEAAQTDIKASIQAAFLQGVRAREFVRSAREPVEFVGEGGRKIVINPSRIRDIYIVSLAGRGGMAVIAANLPTLAPVGMFPAHDYPWAVGLIDLEVVCQFFELPSQLFDYLKRRAAITLDRRFRIHDEWDMLGMYLGGHLDATHPRFEGYDSIVMSRIDDNISNHLLARTRPSLPPTVKPRRQIPEFWFKLLTEIEGCDQLGKTDFITAILGMPDEFLESVSEMTLKCMNLSAADGRIHSFSLFHERSSCGIAVITGRGQPEEISRRLEVLCQAKKYRLKAVKWLGVGIDVSLPNPPHVIAYLDHPWVRDKEMARFTNAMIPWWRWPEVRHRLLKVWLAIRYWSPRRHRRRFHKL
jgi:hypothetical protein